MRGPWGAGLRWRLVAAVGTAGLLALHLTNPLGWPASSIVVGVAALSCIRPGDALLVFAGLCPVTTALAALLGAPGSGTPLLQQLALAASLGAFLRPIQAARLGGPALLVTVVAVASAVSLIPARLAPIAEGSDALAHLVGTMRAGTPQDPVWPPVATALWAVEYAIVGVAVTGLVRADRTLGSRLLLAGLAGHAGAAALNIYRVLEAGLRTGDLWQALPHLLVDVRASMQTDYNAGASALVLAGLAGVGLAVGPRWRKAAVVALVTTCALGTWMTGSRAAILAGGVVAVGAGAWRLIGRLPRLRAPALAVALLLVLAGGVWAVIHYPAGRNDTVGGTLASRWLLTQYGLRMFSSAPVFGVGVAEFRNGILQMGDPAVAERIGAPTENAHNNFVQVLAEQGAVGLVALLVLLGVVLDGLRRQRQAWEPFWLLAAFVACLGTWMTGHPLLVPEFAFVFWLYVGVGAGIAPPLSRAIVRGLVVAACLVAVSAVPRASAERDRAPLEHLGHGLSLWHHDDTQRYRDAGETFRLFLPVGETAVRVPMRRAPGAPDPVTVAWRSEQGDTGTVTLSGDEWRDVPVPLPPGRRAYPVVRFVVVSPAVREAGETLLRVGLDYVPVD